MEIRLHYPQNQRAADQVAAVLTHFEDNLLFHIPVYSLSKKLDISRDDIINIFVYGVYKGVFTLEWLYHCPHCGSIAMETVSINKAVSECFCDSCQASFKNTLDETIEVFFSIHPRFKTFEASLTEQYRRKIEDDVHNGKYRTWLTGETIMGADIIQNNIYRKLMGSDVLIPDQSLQLMQTAILFTDIKNSTQMYTELGDAKAFKLVRDHFRILFETLEKFGGVPVKTMGDAIMGVFTDPRKAVAAAFEAQQRIIAYYADKPKNEHIEIKIGVHSGPALVVNLNDRLDYFGTTVNTAARIQTTALPNEVVISEDLFKNKHIQRTILAVTNTVQKQDITFKGLKNSFSVYHIKVNNMQTAH